MAKKNNGQKKQADKKLEAEKDSDPVVKKYKVKSAKQIGFEKRNYFIGNKNVLIVAGTEVDESTYNAFSDEAKKTFFV